MSQVETPQFILASGSEVRAALLRNAGLQIEIAPARVDEFAIQHSMIAESAPAIDIAAKLAEMKSRKVAERFPDALVLGCDQILECDGLVYSKPNNPAEARQHLRTLSGRTHRLFSAAVVSKEGTPIWRSVGVAKMTMRSISDDYLDSYVSRNWESIRYSVGCYKLEEEGVRLFSRIEGDYFTVLGLPLIELLTWLGNRGDIAT